MPTIRRCCILGCLSNSREQPQLQFFQFPKPENPFHKLWKQACQASLSRILPFKKPVVCALHFRPHCIGGRRLTASAVPSLRLDVSTSLKMMEQQVMVEDIERSRKCAYINAVVYEWLVRANLNPQLRGSITHGMIKEKAETARQIIGSTTFVADNRWLNRFRETHLQGFAQKLAGNQLKPLGPSLWIPDIVQDLQQLFPPTSQIANFENVPEQYVDYMQQYGEYEEDDDQDSKEQTYPNQYQQQQQHQPHQQQYQHQQQQQLHHHNQLQQPHQHSHPLPQHFNHPGYDPYGHHPQPQPNFNYEDYYYGRHQNGQHSNRPSPSPQPLQHASSHSSNSPPLLPQSPSNRQSPFQRPPSAKRIKLNDDGEASVEKSEPMEQIEDLTDEADVEHNVVENGNLANHTANGNSNGHGSGNGNSNGNSNGNKNGTHSGGSSHNNSVGSDHGDENSNHNQTSLKPNVPSPAPSVNDKEDETLSKRLNGDVDSHSTSVSPVPSIKELATYGQALEYLKPLEDFALFKENFRAIGLISQLEVILRKGDTAIAPNLDF